MDHSAAVEIARAAAYAHACRMGAEDTLDSVDPTESVEVWDWYDCGASDAEPCEVLIENLPLIMCANEAFARAMLEQAGLEPFLLDVTMRKRHGRTMGELRVKLSCRMMALYCVQWFGGCQWERVRGAKEIHAAIVEDSQCETSTTNSASVTTGKELDSLALSDSEQSTVAKSERSLCNDTSSEEDCAARLAAARPDRCCWADLSDDDEPRE